MQPVGPAQPVTRLGAAERRAAGDVYAACPRPPGVELRRSTGRAIVFASTVRIRARSPGCRAALHGDASSGGTEVRAQAATLPAPTGGPGPARLHLFVGRPGQPRRLAPAAAAGAADRAALVVTALALFAADRISQALTDLAGRAAIARCGRALRRRRGDELVELGAALDTMSSELSMRVDELEAERGRAQGDAAALRRDAGGDPRPGRRWSAPCWTPPCRRPGRAAAGCCCTTATRGEATEQARIGTARGIAHRPADGRARRAPAWRARRWPSGAAHRPTRRGRC